MALRIGYNGSNLVASRILYLWSYMRSILVLGFNLHANPRSSFHRQAHEEVHSQRVAKTERYSSTEIGGKREVFGNKPEPTANRLLLTNSF